MEADNRKTYKEDLKLLLPALALLGVFSHAEWSEYFWDWFLFSASTLKRYAYSWQELLGAFLGVIASVGIFLWAEHRKETVRQKDYFLLLQKNIIAAINNLSDVDRMLHTFKNAQLKLFKDRLEEDDAAGRWSVGSAFVPLSWTFTFDKELLRETTGSSYLENLVTQVFSISQEMPVILQDISRQFDKTISTNREVGLLRANGSRVHNDILRQNLAEFEHFLKLQTFDHNIPIYLRILVQTKVALALRVKFGMRKWKETFNFSPPFTDETSMKMDAYFKGEVDREIEDLQKHFGSKLLLVGEKSPLQAL